LIFPPKNREAAAGSVAAVSSVFLFVQIDKILMLFAKNIAVLNLL